MTDVPRERPLVMVVDDQDAGRFAKTQIVRRARFDVCEAATGRDALQIARDEDPDLVLLDVNLPDISGFEVCRQLKAQPRAVSRQIVQITATATSDLDHVTGLQGGADAFLVEPVSSEVLIATLKAMERVRSGEVALAAALAREREARDAANLANRLKDQFVAVLSHELRTPLNTMLGWIATLRRGDASAETTARALEGLERSAHQQWRLVNELLDIARIEQGKLELEIARVDLADVVSAAAEMSRATSGSAGVDVELQLASVPISVDAGRLQQVMTNLINNAVQHTLEGGRVVVTLEADNGEARIRVADQGAGISPDVLPHVFEVFRQGDEPLSRRHGGLGLGLPISKAIVEAHGGRLTAESAGLGMGAAFTVVLPR